MKAQQYSGGSGGGADGGKRVIVEGRAGGGRFPVERRQDGKVFDAELSSDKRGYIGKPTVLVGESGKEFVVSAAGVENSTIKPVLDIIDIAQRAGTVANLDLRKVLSSGGVSGKSGGGTFSSSDVRDSSTQEKVNIAKLDSSAQDKKLLDAINMLVSLLNDLKNNDIKAYVVINELNRKIEMEATSKSYASRK
jgi:hypothetical protein